MSPDGEPAVELYDKDKKCRIRLTATADGEPQLWFYDRDENPRLSAALSPEGNVTLGLAARDRNATISLNVQANGNPSLDLTDHTGKPRAILGNTEFGVQPDGATENREVSSLLFSDPNGEIIWKAP
ncbi:MAG TPA: hypothetical protein VKJ47_17945 [Candidatus Binatia bacterium]|nr:hypothetical protein [Candidatus Binatia bacterium]